MDPIQIDEKGKVDDLFLSSFNLLALSSPSLSKKTFQNVSFINVIWYENLGVWNNSENEFKSLIEKKENTSNQSNSTEQKETLEENILNQIKK